MYLGVKKRGIDMKIGVLTDSSAYLSKEQINQFKNVKVVPIPIIWKNSTYYDLVNIGYEEFYEKLAQTDQLPTTSQPSLGELKGKVDEFVNEDYTDLIVIPISSGISSFYSSIESYVKDEERIKIHLFDSKVTCAGLANLVMLAARITQNKNVDPVTVIKYLENLRSTIQVRFIVDDLNYLKRTGRLSNAASFVGGLLNIKPILAMDVRGQGKISAIAKQRQYHRAFNYIEKDFAKLTEAVTYPIYSTVFDALDEKRKSAWLDEYRTKFPNITFASSIIGPVVGVHVGQHAIAMIWHRDIASYFDDKGKLLPME